MQGTLPDVAIKWPNDIYSGGLKLGGALIHTNWRSDRFSVVCGIGLNVSNREPTTCLDELLSRQRAEVRLGLGTGQCPKPQSWCGSSMLQTVWGAVSRFSECAGSPC